MTGRLRSAAALAAAAWFLLAAGTLVSDTGGASAGAGKRLDELEQRGVGEIAPHELERARELMKTAAGEKAQGSPLAPRYAELAALQVDLLEAVETASAKQLEAKAAEKKQHEALLRMQVEKAAYEYFVDQILASGLVSQWAIP
jgi:hypothetical protein